MLHLLRFPPAIEQRRDTARLDYTHVRDDPGGAVAHGDCDAVALAYSACHESVGKAIRNSVELGEGQPLLTGNDCFIGRVQLAKCPEEAGESCRKIRDNRPTLLVTVDGNAAAWARHDIQHLVETAIELTWHFAASPPLPLRPPAL